MRGSAYVDDPSVYDHSRPPPWSKIRLLQKHLPQHEYLLYLDADTIVTNYGFDLSPYVDRLRSDGSSMLLVRDRMNLNTGVMLLRRSEDAMKLLDLIWRGDDLIQDRWWEQASLIREYGRSPWVRNVVSVIPKREHGLLNPTHPKYWTKDSFLMHFAGTPNKALPGQFAKYGPITGETIRTGMLAD